MSSPPKAASPKGASPRAASPQNTGAVVVGRSANVGVFLTQGARTDQLPRLQLGPLEVDDVEDAADSIYGVGVYPRPPHTRAELMIA
jgi:hypothetical protein